MKKISTLLSLMFLATIAFSQTADPDTSWKKGGFIGINFNQVSLSQWAPGGDNNLSLSSSVNLFANYEKNKTHPDALPAWLFRCYGTE